MTDCYLILIRYWASELTLAIAAKFLRVLQVFAPGKFLNTLQLATQNKKDG